MSRITLKANASGTGNITLASPNSNSDFTQTLMAVAGTLLASADTQTANEKLFVNDGATALEFAKGFAIGTFDIATATDDSKTISTVGFTPSLLILFGVVDNTQTMSFGVSNGSSHFCISMYPTSALWTRDSYALRIYTSASSSTQATAVTFNSSGFILTLARTGTPSGTANVRYIAFR